MAVKLPRTIQLDPSDKFVFDRAAVPGEWAVSGSFMFVRDEPSSLVGKRRAAFRSGFLGIASLGWSTLAVVTEASAEEHAAAIETLAVNLRDRLGAPDLAAARAAAAEEIAFAASVCNHPAQTLIAVHRVWQGSDIRERFRTLRTREDVIGPGRVFDLVPDDEAEPIENANLIEIMRRGQP